MSISKKNQLPLISIVFVVLITALYYPVIKGSFFNDDLLYITNNHLLQNIPLRDVWKIFLSRTNDYEYLPMRDLSYKIDLALFGLNPVGFHIHNLVLYILTCISVFLCTRSMFSLFQPEDESSENNTASIIAVSLLFAVHPAHVESAAWISGRKDLLSGLFALLSLWQLTSALEKNISGRMLRLGTAYFLFLLAILSKSTVTPLALIALLIVFVKYSDEFPKPRALWHSIFMVFPYFVLSFGSVIIQIIVGKQTKILTETRAEALSFSQAVELPVKILGYLTHIGLAPFNLRLIYDVNDPGWRSAVALFCGLFALLACIVALVQFYRKKSFVALGIIIFVTFSLPFLQIIRFETWSFASERFLFMPVFGAAMCLAVIFKNLRFGATVILPVVIFGWASLTVARCVEWKMPTEMARADFKHSPGSFEAVERLLQIGLLPEKRYDEAYEAVSKVKNKIWKMNLTAYIDAHKALTEGNAVNRKKVLVQIKKMSFDSIADSDLFLTLGKLCESEGDYFQAAYYYFSAKRLQPDTATIPFENVQKYFEQPLRKLEAMLAMNPDDMASLQQLAGLYLELYQLDKAEALYRQGLTRVKDTMSNQYIRYNLGITLLREKRYQEAAGEIEHSINSGLVIPEAWNNLGVIYKNLGVFEKARDCFRKAMAIDNLHHNSAINLGLLYESRGENKLALESYLEAQRRLRIKGQQTDVLNTYIERLQ